MNETVDAAALPPEELKRIAEENYLQRLTEFVGEHGTQPFKENRAAEDLVLGANVIYPQSFDGAPIIVADKILSPAANTEPVSLMQLASLVPEPDYCARRANAVHERYHIPAVVTPAGATMVASRNVIQALERIRWETVDSLEEQGIVGVELPPVANYDDDPHAEADARYGPWAIDLDAVRALEECLSAYPTVRADIAAGLRTEAEMFVSKGKAWRTSIEARYTQPSTIPSETPPQ